MILEVDSKWTEMCVKGQPIVDVINVRGRNCWLQHSDKTSPDVCRIFWAAVAGRGSVSITDVNTFLWLLVSLLTRWQL